MQAERRHGRRASLRRRTSRAEQVQIRRLVLCVCLLASMVVITAVASYSSRVEAATPETSATVFEATPSTTLDPAVLLVSATYTAELRGGGSGSLSGDPRAFLTLRYDAGAQTITFKLQITSSLQVPCVAAICRGRPSQSGSTVFTLFPGPAIAGNFSGVLAEGQIDAADLVGSLKGSRLADLILLIESGKAYATIGTASQPAGAIRGQIK
jgi:hypothetical protein